MQSLRPARCRRIRQRNYDESHDLRLGLNRQLPTEECAANDTPGPLGMPLQNTVTMDAIVRTSRYASSPAARGGAFNPVGPVVCMMNEVRSAYEVITRLVEEYIDAVDRLDALQPELCRRHSLRLALSRDRAAIGRTAARLAEAGDQPRDAASVRRDASPRGIEAHFVPPRPPLVPSH